MPNSFKKAITLTGGVSILTGIMVGSGIFFVGSLVLDTTNYSFGFALLAWLIGGLLTLSYALMYGELGSKYPRVGGYYAYLKKAYGPQVGFSAGFFNFVLASSGSVAVLALAFSEVTNNILLTVSAGEVGMTTLVQILLAGVMIVLLTTMNVFGVKLNTVFLKVIMVIKFIPIVTLIILGFTIGTQPLDLSFDMGGVGFFEGATLLGFAVIFTFWAYEGWTNLNTVAEEMQNPQKDLPKALLITMVGVTLLYVLYQASIMQSIDQATLQGTYESGFLFIGIPATMALVGEWGSYIIMGTIFVAILGALNASILSFSRVYFALADDFKALKPLATLHANYQTPVKALIISAVMALILLPFQIGDLISLVAFGGLVFNSLVFISIFINRRRDPEAEGYSVPFYPVLPALTIGITGLLLVAIFIQNPVFSTVGLAVIVLSLPVYYLINQLSQ